jgi:hypothetical protein
MRVYVVVYTMNLLFRIILEITYIFEDRETAIAGPISRIPT